MNYDLFKIIFYFVVKDFSNSCDYQNHLNICPNWQSNKHNKCVFCNKVFKTVFDMTEHVKLHGPDRYTCSLCNLNVPSLYAIEYHMKDKHAIINLKLVPVHTEFTDTEKDKFIVHIDKKQQSKNTPNGVSVSFKCRECDFISVKQKHIISHLRDRHNIDKFETHIVKSSLNGDYKEVFEIRKIDASLNLKSPEKLIPTKRKRNTNYFDVSNILLFKIKYNSILFSLILSILCCIYIVNCIILIIY